MNLCINIVFVIMCSMAYIYCTNDIGFESSVEDVMEPIATELQDEVPTALKAEFAEEDVAEPFVDKSEPITNEEGIASDNVEDSKQDGDIIVKQLPELPEVPSLPSLPGLPSLPSLPALPELPSLPALPSLPSLPALPNLPGLPGLFGLQDAPAPDTPQPNPFTLSPSNLANVVEALPGEIANQLITAFFDRLLANVNSEPLVPVDFNSADKAAKATKASKATDTTVTATTATTVSTASTATTVTATTATTATTAKVTTGTPTPTTTAATTVTEPHGIKTAIKYKMVKIINALGTAVSNLIRVKIGRQGPLDDAPCEMDSVVKEILLFELQYSDKFKDLVGNPVDYIKTENEAIGENAYGPYPFLFRNAEEILKK